MALTQQQINRVIEKLNSDSDRQRDALIAAIDADSDTDQCCESCSDEWCTCVDGPRRILIER